MGLALALIPVLLYPVLRRTSDRLAIGYIVFRGALETSAYVVTAVSWLVLGRLGRELADGGADAGAGPMARIVAYISETAASTTGAVVFLLGATMFYTVLYRARLVPRWLSVWGLLAVLPSLAYALLASAGSPPAGVEGALDAPLGLQEVVLAVWLVVRGFTPTSSSTIDSSTPEGRRGTVLTVGLQRT